MRNRVIRLSVAAIVLTTLVWLPGCSGSGSSAVIPNISGADGRRLPTKAPAPKMHVVAATDKTTYKTGEPINITVSVTNTDSIAHSLVYPTSDPITKWGYIISLNGTIVTYEYWTGHNLVFPDAVTTDQYGPGQTRQFSYVYPYAPTPSSPPQVSSLPAGTYQITARQSDLTYDNQSPIRFSTPTPASDPVTFTVTP